MKRRSLMLITALAMMLSVGAFSVGGVSAAGPETMSSPAMGWCGRC